ncbi:MAG: hypothetical protein ACK4TC_17210 [Sphingomonas pseudosanguinis]|uniref:hypothetical protein n=1 Tax=Sphingomonas pseudosanguinis TaxID=413712 RepID=UPI00391BE447
MNQVQGTTITSTSGVFFLGKKSAIHHVKQRGLRVMLDDSVDFIAMTWGNDEFCTYGPTGGSFRPYQAIEWAYKNLDAFGVEIVDDGAVKRPAIWVPKRKHVMKMAKHLADLAGARLTQL